METFCFRRGLFRADRIRVSAILHFSPVKEEKAKRESRLRSKPIRFSGKIKFLENISPIHRKRETFSEESSAPERDSRLKIIFSNSDKRAIPARDRKTRNSLSGGNQERKKNPLPDPFKETKTGLFSPSRKENRRSGSCSPSLPGSAVRRSEHDSGIRGTETSPSFAQRRPPPSPRTLRNGKYAEKLRQFRFHPLPEHAAILSHDSPKRHGPAGKSGRSPEKNLHLLRGPH